MLSCNAEIVSIAFSVHTWVHVGVHVGLPLSSGFSKNYGDWSSRREYVYTNTRNEVNPKATQVPWRCRSPPVSLQDSERGTSSRKIRFVKNITSYFV